VQSRVGGPFPWGTFVVNVSGSFALGVLTGLALYHAFPEEPRIVLGAGFCGAYTTFSTFGLETVRLLEQDAPAAACRNALGTLWPAPSPPGSGWPSPPSEVTQRSL
jgi:CrcB protein